MGNAGSIAGNLGVQYLAVVLSSILFGITTLQVYIYYQLYPEDKIQHRIVVSLLWVLDAFHLSMVVHACYIYLVLRLPLDDILWSMQVEILDTELITVIVTCLYVVRIWNFARRPRRYLACVLVSAQLMQTTASIVDVYTDYSCRNLSRISSLFWALPYCLASHAFVDCLLAGIMCYYLQKSRAGPGFSSVDSTVVKLMQYIIGSGVVTAACAIATLIALIVRPYSLIWTVFYYMLSKLYINSYLAFLNGRQHIRKRIEGPSSLMLPSDVRFVGDEDYIQSSHSGSTGSPHSNNAKAGPSLLNLNDTRSSEGLAADKKVMISTFLTV